MVGAERADRGAEDGDQAALGQFAGPDGTVAQYALPYKQETKSFIWYSPDNFAEMGYEVPTTMEELMELEQQIIADGGTPWCIGVEYKICGCSACVSRFLCYWRRIVSFHRMILRVCCAVRDDFVPL